METNIHFFIYLSILIRMRDFQTRQKIKTPILYSITFFPENRTFSGIMCKNIVVLDRPQRNDACALRAGYLRLQTHTEYVIFIAVQLEKWLHERPYCYATRMLPAAVMFCDIFR